MDQVRFGDTGLKVSKICLGCMTYGDPDWRPWVLDEERSRPLIRQAIESGITFLDTANMYSIGRSEEIVGRAIADFGRRDDFVIATKVYFPMSESPNDRGLSRKHILSSIEASLKRLGTDYVDLLIIHRFDPQTPIEETIEAFDIVVKHGKARYIGASSMFAWQFAKMRAMQEAGGLARFVSMQNHLNLLYREEEREMLPYCLSEGVAVTPWSPLARGLLARPPQEKTARADSDTQAPQWYRREDENRAIIAAVARVAERHGVPPAQIALAWVLAKAEVTAPIVGASKPGQIEDAVAALKITLGEDDIAELEADYTPRPVAGHG